MAVHLTTNEINQGSSGFLLRLPFSLDGYSDSYIGQTWRVKIVTPDGTIVSRTTGIEFLTDAPLISVPIQDFDLILAGTYYYQVTLTTGGANINSPVRSFFIKPSLPEGLPYSIISSAFNYFPIFTSGGALAQSGLRIDGDGDLNFNDGGKFAGPVTVSDEAYSSAWNGKLEVPTKNAIYDAISSGIFGEANTASNVGASGIGVFHAKSGVDLQFRKLNSTTNRLTIALNSNQIDFTINEGNLSIASSQITGDFAQSRITGLVTDLANKQPKHSSLDQISALTPSNDDIIQRKAGVWTNRTVTQFKADLSLTKTDVGLGNVDNTSDALKPISAATQGALDLKADKTGATFTGPISVPDDAYGIGWNGNTSVPTKNAIYDKIESLTVGGVTDGDKGDITVSSTGTVWTIDNNVVTVGKLEQIPSGTFLGRVSASTGNVQILSATDAKTALALVKGDVGLGNVLNLDQSNAANITSGTINVARLGSGTANSTTFLRGDNAWVSLNSNLETIYQHKYLSSYTSWTNALSTIGSTPTVLIVNTTMTFSADVTLPNTLKLQVEGENTINIASGVVVNGPPPQNMPNRQIFTGLGQYRIKSNHPAAGLLLGIWWLPDATVTAQTITTAMRTAMQESQTNNFGSTLVLPQGKYFIDAPFQIKYGSLRGSGAFPSPNVVAPYSGTILELTTNSTSAIRVMQGARNVTISNLTVYAQDSVTGAQGILLTGTGGSDLNIVGVRLEGVITYGFEDAVKCYSISGDYEFDSIVIDQQCQFINYSSSGFYVNSVNGKYELNAYVYLGRPNGQSVHFRLLRWGTCYVDGHGRGTHTSSIAPFDTYRETEQFTVTSSAFTVGSTTITKTGHNLQTGDSLKLNVPTGSDSNLPTVSGFTFANGNRCWAYRIDANTFRVCSTPDNARNGIGMPITALPTADVKFWSERPNTVVANQRQYAVFYLGSVSTTGGLSVTNWQDEGLPYFMIVDDPQGLGIYNEYNYYPPISLRQVYTVGQILFKRNCEVIMDGCSLPLHSLHDDYDVQARVRMRGCVPVHVGIGGAAYTRAGFFPSHPYRFDDFKGASVVETDDNHEDGFITRRNANDTPLMAMEVWINSAPIKLRTWWERLGSGIKAGWWKQFTTYDTAITPANFGGDNQYAGFAFGGAVSYKGRLINERPADALTVGSGTLTADLKINNEFIGTPAQDATINFVNANTGHGQLVIVRLKTSGTTSYNITAGTNVQMNGTLITGTVSGVYHVLQFYYDSIDGKLIEVARQSTGGLNVGNSVSGGTNNTVLFKDGSGNLASNSNLGWNGSVLAVTGNLTVTDQAFSTSWNGSLQVPTKNAIYDRLQVLHNYVVVEDHASFSAALSYIASNYSGVDVELRIGSTVNVTTDTVVPSNVYVSWNGSGLFNISAGVTLEIRAMINPGPRKLYTGAGKMTLTRNVEVWAAWWIGKVGDNNPNQYATISDVQWDGMISSGYGGLILRFTEGQFRTNSTLSLTRKYWNGSAWVNSGLTATGITVKGVGSFPDPSSAIEAEGNYLGTVIRIMTNTTNLFEVVSNLRYVSFEGICFYASLSLTGQVLVDINAHNTTQVRFDSCSFYGGDIGLRCKSVDVGGGPNGNYLINIQADNCIFVNSKVACFKSETVNTSYRFESCAFAPGRTSGTTPMESIGAWLYYSGTSKFISCTFEGTNINERGIHSLITAHNSSTGLTTIPSHGATVGSLEPVTIRNTQMESNTVVAPSNVTGSGNARIVITYNDTVTPSNNGWQFAGEGGASIPTITVDFAVVAGDTPAQIATKARTALSANEYVKQAFSVGGTGATITLHVLAGEQLVLNDPYWNFSIQNAPTGGSTGITTSASSTSTAATTANLPTGYVDKTVLYFQAVDANTGYFYESPLQAWNTALSKKFSSIGTNNIMRTQIMRKYGTTYLQQGIYTVPYSAIKIEQSIMQVSIDNCQDEGFQHSLVVDNTYDDTRAIEITNTTMQSTVLLNSICYVVCTSSTFVNKAFRDKYGMTGIAKCESRGDSPSVGASVGSRDFARTQHATYSLGHFVAGSYFRVEDNKWTDAIFRSTFRIAPPIAVSATTPALDISKYQDDSSTALLIRLGGRAYNGESANYYYDISIVNDPTPSSLLVPATQGYLEFKPYNQDIYGGVFVRGHLAKYGREYNALNIALGNSGTVNVDCSLGSRFSCSPSGDITFTFSNVAPGQLVTVFVEANSTSKNITWSGSNIYSTGARTFKTGTIAGYYQFQFWASSGGTLLQIGSPRLATASYVIPNPEMFWGADTTATITLADGDRRTANSASRIDYTLPSAPVYGTTCAVKGTNTGGFRIYLGNASHLIRWSQGSTVGTDITTTGTAGYIGSTDGWDYVQLTYWGNNVWSPTGIKGAFTIN